MAFQHMKDGAFARIVAALAALSLALSLSMGVLAYSAGDAYAAVHAVEDDAAAQVAATADGDVAVDADASESAGAAESQLAAVAPNADAAEAEPAATGEQLADADTPLYSGVPELAKASAPTGSFFWAIMAGIVAVAVFFGMSTSKVNRSIRQMSGKFQ